MISGNYLRALDSKDLVVFPNEIICKQLLPVEMDLLRNRSDTGRLVNFYIYIKFRCSLASCKLLILKNSKNKTKPNNTKQNGEDNWIIY